MRKFTDTSDSELLTMMRGDDEGAFNEVFHRYWDKIFSVAHNRIQDEEKAKEIVQDVFVSLWNRRHSLSITYKLITYLSIATKYQVINYQNRELRRQEALLSALPPTEEARDTTDLWFSEKELIELLEAGIAQLPEKCRVVFVLSRHDGLSNASIAAELGVSEKTVEAHITRALAKLKRILPISIWIAFCV